MPCTCNSICDHDCSSNQLCTGHVPACSNTYIFSAISIGSIVRANDILTLQTAINTERVDTGRRFTANEPDYCYTHTPGDLACTSNDFTSFPWTAGVGVGNTVLGAHYAGPKNAINEMVNNSGYGSLVTATFAAGAIIYASAITELQTRINQSRNVCICDSHCNCDPSDCGCNGECPSDDYYSYYYYP